MVTEKVFECLGTWVGDLDHMSFKGVRNDVEAYGYLDRYEDSVAKVHQLHEASVLESWSRVSSTF